MDYMEFKRAVESAARDAGLEAFDLYCRRHVETGAHVIGREVDGFTSAVRAGACLRCLWDGKPGYAATQLFNQKEAEELVRRARDNADVLDAGDEIFFFPPGSDYRGADAAVEAPPDRAVADLALDCQNRTLDGDSRAMDGTQSDCAFYAADMYLSNSNGLNLETHWSYSSLYQDAVLSEGGRMYSGCEYDAGGFPTLSAAEISSGARLRAAGTIGAVTPQSGNLPAVFSPRAAASLLSVFSPVFSAENTQKGKSLLKGRVGEQIASPAATLTDDPFCAQSPVHIPFDAEGAPSRAKNIVEGGVLQTLLYNLKTARKDGVSTTGNASRAGYASPVEVAPFNFYFQPGAFSLEELLAQAGRGILITDLQGLHAGADSVTGDFSLQSSGFLIENGKLSAPVNGFTVAGNFFDWLKGIAAAGKGLWFDLPQGVTVFGSPPLLVEHVAVSGG